MLVLAELNERAITIEESRKAVNEISRKRTRVDELPAVKNKVWLAKLEHFLARSVLVD